MSVENRQKKTGRRGGGGKTSLLKDFAVSERKKDTLLKNLAAFIKFYLLQILNKKKGNTITYIAI